jgi:DNA-binding CsgD family transcriptional regulator
MQQTREPKIRLLKTDPEVHIILLLEDELTRLRKILQIGSLKGTSENGHAQKANPVENHRVGFSRQETEILQMVGQEYTSQEIAPRLFIGVKTVETHRTGMTKKLGVHG